MRRGLRSLCLMGAGAAAALACTGATGGLPARPAAAGAALEPIPALDDEPPPPCGGERPADYYQFLDDTCHVKRQPSRYDREQACPIADREAAGYRASSEAIVVENVLDGIVPPEIDVAVIAIRRVGGAPRYRYLSNGTAERPVQPWSSTKWLAAANAATRLRGASGGAVGLTAAVDGYPLGDLVTSMARYDDAPFTSNGLGRYFHDVGGRERANELIHGWLGRPAAETFGGNYGEPAPALGHTFVEPAGAEVSVEPDPSAGPANRLSMLTLAEALKRTVLYREEPAQRLPGLTWPDVRVLLHGAEGSPRYGRWSGLADDKAIYLQSAHDWSYIERRSRGRWRIFSKLGMGDRGQFINVAYACLPVLDARGQPVPDQGRELVIAAHIATGDADYALRDRALARAFRAIVIRLVDGRL